MELKDILKRKRIEHHLTQEQLAEKIFVSNKTISNWETGKTTPDIDSLILLANLFHFSLDILLEEKKIVKNIKKREELKGIQKMLFATLIVDLVFLFILLTQDNFGRLALPVIIALCIGTVTNVGVIFYFANRQAELEGRNKSENIKVFILSMCVFLAMILIFYLRKKFS